MTTAFKGTIIHAVKFGELDVIENGGLFVASDGTIAFVARTPAEFEQYAKDHSVAADRIVSLGNRVLIPGFIDTHCHAPQYVFTGTGNGIPLLDWLKKYTFNYESKFSDTEYAKSSYTKAVKRFVRNGTTTTCYFATIHLEASKLLADICAEVGQRAFIGKVCMDRNAPDHYIETTDASAADTEKLIQYCQAKHNGLITPIITPRFVPTCSSGLMKQLGDLATKYNVPIQSHVSENKDEVSWVHSLHPECADYTSVYNDYGLLNSKTILAHGCHLDDKELALIKQKGAALSHCALSNYNLVSGCMRPRRILKSGVKFGLGTDVSGGIHPSMLAVIRHTLTNSATAQFVTPPDDGPVLSWQEAFYLATLGGAEALNIEKQVGSFAVGKALDALIVDYYVKDSPFDIFEHDTLLEKFEKFIYLGDDRNITSIYVQGKLAAL